MARPPGWIRAEREERRRLADLMDLAIRAVLTDRGERLLTKVQLFELLVNEGQSREAI